MKQAFASVISDREVAPETHLVWLESAEIAAAARPGQFVMASCGENTLLRRPLSIHRVDGDKFAVLFQIVGKGTGWLSRLKAGDSLDVLGPLGNGFTIQPVTKNIILVAGGIGVAPLAFLAEVAVKQGVEAVLLQGACSAENCLDLSRSEEQPLNINIIKATDDGSLGYKGLVTDLISNHADQADQIFACGPLPMYKTMARMPELKYKPVQVSLEVRMACGLGICYGCTVKTRKGLKQVCSDGPVFELNDVLWDEVVC